jgi:SAM-dependent methyltransferase
VTSVDERRLTPRIWRDADWLVLRQLRMAIEAALSRRVPPGAGHRVVDFGCGDRPYEGLVKSRGAAYVTCDLDGEVDVRIVPGQALGLPDGYADGVVSFQVLEHVWDLDWYLGECWRLLKPGGWLLLSTHGSWPYHPHPTDFRRWTRDGLVRELETRGFAVENVAAVAGPLAWTTVYRLLGVQQALKRVPLVGAVLAAPILLAANTWIAIEDALTPRALRESDACVHVTLSRKAG